MSRRARSPKRKWVIILNIKAAFINQRYNLDVKIKEQGKEFIFKNKSKFLEFYRSISRIKDNVINLDNLKSFLTIKIESFPYPKEIIEIYEKVLKKSSFSRY